MIVVVVVMEQPLVQSRVLIAILDSVISGLCASCVSEYWRQFRHVPPTYQNEERSDILKLFPASSEAMKPAATSALEYFSSSFSLSTLMHFIKKTKRLTSRSHYVSSLEELMYSFHIKFWCGCTGRTPLANSCWRYFYNRLTSVVDMFTKASFWKK